VLDEMNRPDPIKPALVSNLALEDSHILALLARNAWSEAFEIGRR
jgi:hypothetical protein